MTMKLLIDKISIIITVSYLSFPSYAIELSEVDCDNSVKHGSAAFVILNPEGEEGWTWNKTSSENGLLEYQWAVTLGEITEEGVFKGTGKSFGFTLFKWNEKSQMSGNLSELIQHGQYTAWATACHNDGTTHNIIESARVKAGIFMDSILLGTNDLDTYELLLNDKPEAAYIEAYLSAINKQYTCTIYINYFEGG